MITNLRNQTINKCKKNEFKKCIFKIIEYRYKNEFEQDVSNEQQPHLILDTFYDECLHFLLLNVSIAWILSQ